MASFNKLDVVIVEKNGNLKCLSIKDFDESELYKKCGFKSTNNFGKQTVWEIKIDSVKYSISVYAKSDGKANTENKYDFPPPIDSSLFFGNCVIVGMKYNKDNVLENTSLSLEMWEKMYEKLFGGFENLDVVAVDDENEEDELDNISDKLKTKDGYLKDGFVVDDSGGEEDDVDESIYESEDEDDGSDTEGDTSEDNIDELIGDLPEDNGSELSEDSYE